MNHNDKAIIFDIQKCSLVDGPGMRTTVFFKGCNLRCKWCHNPESQDARREMMYHKNRCSACGKCKDICPFQLEDCKLCGKCTVYCLQRAREIAGETYKVETLLQEIVADKLFYQTSGGGVTFSGGECLLQTDFLAQLLQMCKEEKIHTAVDTAGCVPWEHFEKVIPYTDLFLYDLKCFSEELHREGTGVSNRLILENLRRLSCDTDREILIRIPIIPGFNTQPEELQRMAEFVKTLRCSAVELLPYHTMGIHKYEALGRSACIYSVPSEADMEECWKVFK